LGGQTRNPRGPFDVSGSSSGSGAGMAANFAALAIGTETSGSITSPAAHNGVCGLKPSLGAISRDAIIPITDAQDTAGPMTRNMTDLALLFEVICAEDESDPMSYFAFHGSDCLKRSDLYTLAGKRVALVRASLEREDDAEIAERAIAILRKAGAEVVEAIITASQPESSEVYPIYHAGFKRGVNAYLAEAGAGMTVADVIAFNKQDMPSRAPYGMDFLEKSGASEMSEADYEANVLRNRSLCAAAIRNTLANYNANFLMSVNTGLVFLAACAGFPSLSVPAGLRPNGEPAGLLLVGNYLADWDLIGAGRAFELKIRN
jgi:amidase